MQVLEEPVGQLVGAGGAARAAVLPLGVEHEVVDDQLRTAFEDAGERHLPVRAVEDVVLLDLDHRQIATFDVEGVAGTCQLFLLLQELEARGAPILT